MRIAAGVLLIILSLISACAGAGYTFAGAAASAVSEAAVQADKTELKDDQGNKVGEINLSETDKASLESAKSTGGGLAFFGIFLLVMFGLEIAGAVCLFTQKAPMLVLVVGGLAIAAEIGGILIVRSLTSGLGGEASTIGITNIFGLVAGALAIVASRSYGKAPAAA